jgi:hypothetical protein
LNTGYSRFDETLCLANKLATRHMQKIISKTGDGPDWFGLIHELNPENDFEPLICAHRR